MPPSRHSQTSSERYSEAEIRALDPNLFSAKEKRIFIELLHGDSDNAGWRDKLRSTEANRKRWNAFFAKPASMVQPYKWRHQLILHQARRRPPTTTKSTVTGFTDWIFGLYESKQNILKLEIGRRLEREIVAKRIPLPEHSRWKVDYNGTAASKAKSLPISALQVNGAGLRGKPDLVFREKHTGRVIILEIKVSDAPIPSDGWPNLRAQLWAYSKADRWNDAPSVMLVGEIWAKSGRLRCRDAIHWDGLDQTLDGQCAELFEVYRRHSAALELGTSA